MKFIDLQSKRADLRDLEKDIDLTRRELIPLTTGLIADVKRRRTARLRERIHLLRNSAKTVQTAVRRVTILLCVWCYCIWACCLLCRML